MNLLRLITTRQNSSFAYPTPVGTPVLYLDAGNPNSYPGSGNTWTDLSANSYSFSMSNFTATSNYITLNGSTTNINMGASLPAVENGTNNFTVSIWYQRHNTTGLQELVSSWPGTNMFTSFFFGFNGTTTIRVGDGYSAGVAGVNITNTWQNLTLVNDATNNNAYIYLNGSLVVTKGSKLSSIVNSQNTFYIGRQGNAGEVLNGKIAVVRI